MALHNNWIIPPFCHFAGCFSYRPVDHNGNQVSRTKCTIGVASVHFAVCDHGHFFSDRPNQREPDRRVISMYAVDFR